MNHTLKIRSALVRAAERGLGIKDRPAAASDVVCAARREPQRGKDSGAIFAICAVVIGSYLVMAFLAQVFA